MSRPSHSDAFRVARFLNWFPLGLAYMFLYAGRYNINPAKETLSGLIGGNAGLGTINTVGAIVYGVAFILNGPLTERMGGQRAMILATIGSALSNALIGAFVISSDHAHALTILSVLYGLNMYFQSFGAVAIVKVNAAWFHVTERGRFGGYFGIMISTGLFLAYTVEPVVFDYFFPGRPHLYFFAPAGVLFAMGLATLLFIRDVPSQKGHPDFETGSSIEFESDQPLKVLDVFGRMLRNRVVLTIAFVELCTGVLRNGVAAWYGAYANQMGAPGLRAALGFGLWPAGVFGGLFAGYLSDKVFQSRRPPVAGLLYVVMIALTAIGSLTLLLGGRHPVVPYLVFGLVVGISFCVIGTHGVLSGTAAADFGGKRATATAVGIIDGFVYLGVAIQSQSIGYLTARGWTTWFPFLLPFAIVGLILCTRIWHARPTTGKAAH